MSATFGGESASYASELIWHSVLIESDYETQDIPLPQDSGEEGGGSSSQHVRPESRASGIPVRYPVGRRRPEPAPPRRVDFSEPQHHRHEIVARDCRRPAPHGYRAVRRVAGVRGADLGQAAGRGTVGTLLRDLPGAGRGADCRRRSDRPVSGNQPMTLVDLRKLAIRKQFKIRFVLRNGMECVISEDGIAHVPALNSVPELNLEQELAAATASAVEAAVPAGMKNTPTE